MCATHYISLPGWNRLASGVLFKHAGAKDVPARINDQRSAKTRAMKILVAVDGSDYSRMAIEFVASRRTLIKCNPDVEVLHIQTPLPANPARVVGTKVVHSYYADEAEKVLKPARLRLHRAGLSPTVRYVVGRPAIEISKTADKDDVDLLVLGSHGHSALAGMLLGSVTNEVLVRTKRAVLIVRGKAKRYPDSLRIGIAVDGSRYSQEAVKYVRRFTKLFGARLNVSLIHVVPEYDLRGQPSRAGYLIPDVAAKEARALQDEAFEDAVAPMRRFFKRKVGIKLEEVRLVGNAGTQLPTHARKNVDLLVLGSHGYGAFKAAVMGSVATRVAAHSSLPLLFVRA